MSQENEKNRIDELFREKLGDYAVPSPDRIWENIAQKRTFGYVAKNLLLKSIKNHYALLLIAIFGISGILFFNYNNLSSNTEPTSALVDNKVVATKGFEPGNTSSAEVKKGNNKVESESPLLKPQLAEKSISKTTTTSSPTASVSTNLAANSPAIDSKSVLTASENQVITSSSSSSSNAAITDKKIANTPDKEKINEKNNNVLTDNGNDAVVSSNNGSAPILSNATTEITSTNPLLDSTVSAVIAIDSVKKDDVTVLADSAGSKPITTATSEELKNAKVSTTHEFKLGFTYGPNVVTSLVKVANGDNQEYLNKYKASERLNYSFTAGAHLSYQLNPHWVLNSGLLYTQTKKHFVYETPEYFEAYGTQIHNPYTIAYNSPVYYMFWDIPLTVSYQHTCNKWNVYVSAGASINVAFKQEGMMLSHQGQFKIVDLAEVTTNPYNSTAGVQLLAGVGAAYNFSNNLAVFIEPLSRFGTNSYSKSTAPFTIRNNYYSMFGGIRFSIF